MVDAPLLLGEVWLKSACSVRVGIYCPDQRMDCTVLRNYVSVVCNHSGWVSNPARGALTSVLFEVVVEARG